jgi:hypothetical protein
VGFRTLHTLVQCTINRVTLRFLLFSLGTFALMAMAVRAVLAL